MWHYQDVIGDEYGPYPETQMREWLLDRRYGPELKVKLPSMTRFLKLHTLYTLGGPPMWEKTTLLSDYKHRRSIPRAAASHPPHQVTAVQHETASSSRCSPLPPVTIESDRLKKRKQRSNIPLENKKIKMKSLSTFAMIMNSPLAVVIRRKMMGCRSRNGHRVLVLLAFEVVLFAIGIIAFFHFGTITVFVYAYWTAKHALSLGSRRRDKCTATTASIPLSSCR